MKMQNKWELLRDNLLKSRKMLAETYFFIPLKANEIKGYDKLVEIYILSALGEIDHAIKVAESHILSSKEFDSKYEYGCGFEVDDHTSVWGGAGPDCIPVPG